MRRLYPTLWAALATFILVLPQARPSEIVAPPSRLFAGVRIMPPDIAPAPAKSAASAAKKQPQARRAESNR